MTAQNNSKQGSLLDTMGYEVFINTAVTLYQILHKLHVALFWAIQTSAWWYRQGAQGVCGGASAGGGPAAGAVGAPSQRTQPATHLLHAHSARQKIRRGADQGGCAGGVHLCYLYLQAVQMTIGQSFVKMLCFRKIA